MRFLPYYKKNTFEEAVYFNIFGLLFYSLLKFDCILCSSRFNLKFLSIEF